MIIPRTGVLQRLKRLSERLAPQFGWDAAQAVTFVLTGVPPLVETIEMQKGRRANSGLPRRIGLSVALSAPPERVAAAYKECRDALLPEGVRTLSERQFRLMLFALQNPELKGTPLFMAWNTKHPKWRYRHYPSFSRAITETRERLADLHTLGSGSRSAEVKRIGEH
jgi:hypothetical protein